MNIEVEQLRSELIRFAMADIKSNSFYSRKQVERRVDKYLNTIRASINDDSKEVQSGRSNTC